MTATGGARARGRSRVWAGAMSGVSGHGSWVRDKARGRVPVRARTRYRVHARSRVRVLVRVGVLVRVRVHVRVLARARA